MPEPVLPVPPRPHPGSHLRGPAPKPTPPAPRPGGLGPGGGFRRKARRGGRGAGPSLRHGRGERASGTPPPGGRQARAAHYAVDEAVASYRKAIEINDSKMTGQGSAELAVELRAQLADVLWRSNRLAEARETLQEALVLVGPERTVASGQPARPLGAGGGGIRSPGAKATSATRLPWRRSTPLKNFWAITQRNEATSGSTYGWRSS